MQHGFDQALQAGGGGGPPPGVRFAVAAATGRAHERQGVPAEDSHQCEAPLRGSGGRAALFCVFDGHAGASAARRAGELLPGRVAAAVATCGGGGGGGGGSGGPDAAAWTAAFLETDDELASECEGTTATALLVRRPGPGNPAPPGTFYLQAANVGDSGCIVGSRERGWQMLTYAHRLTDLAERDRLRKLAGVQLRDGEKRLYGLSLSRALGDRLFKNEETGLSAEPHVSESVSVTASADSPVFAVLASDGLWDYVSEKRIAELVEEIGAATGGSPEAISGVLLEQAAANRSGDDVTVCVVRLGGGD